MIKKNLNCLLSFSMLLYFSWCKKGHICLKFHKSVIYSVIKIKFFMLLFIIVAIIFFLKMSSVFNFRTDFFIIHSVFYITNAVSVLIPDFAMERRDLKAPLALTWVKREASKRGRFRGKSLLLVRHCQSKCNHK